MIDDSSPSFVNVACEYFLSGYFELSERANFMSEFPSNVTVLGVTP